MTEITTLATFRVTSTVCECSTLSLTFTRPSFTFQPSTSKLGLPSSITWVTQAEQARTCFGHRTSGAQAHARGNGSNEANLNDAKHCTTPLDQSLACISSHHCHQPRLQTTHFCSFDSTRTHTHAPCLHTILPHFHKPATTTVRTCSHELD